MNLHIVLFLQNDFGYGTRIYGPAINYLHKHNNYAICRWSGGVTSRLKSGREFAPINYPRDDQFCSHDIMNSKTTSFLLADDDRDDQEMFKDVLLEILPQSTIHSVANGRAVIDFLDKCADQDLPNLIVLDYNMPKGNGPDVLDELKGHFRYGGIPKIIWSTSGSEDFIRICIRKGAKAFFIKPDNFSELKQMIGEITRFAVIPPS